MKIKTGDISIVENAGTFLLWYDTRRVSIDCNYIWGYTLRFEWDPKKRETNLGKHGLDLVDAVPIFEGPMLALPDTQQDYGEDRWIGVGITNGRVAVVAFAECGADAFALSPWERQTGMSVNSSRKRSKNELEEG